MQQHTLASLQKLYMRKGVAEIISTIAPFIQGVSQKGPPKIFVHISQNPADLCKVFFTSFNLCSFVVFPRGN